MRYKTPKTMGAGWFVLASPRPSEFRRSIVVSFLQIVASTLIMHDLKNKLAAALFGLLAVLAAPVWAAAPITHYTVNNGHSGYTYPYFSTKGAACADSIAYYKAIGGPDSYTAADVGSYCQYLNSAGSVVANYSYDAKSKCAGGTAPDTTKPLDEQCTTLCPTSEFSMQLPKGYDTTPNPAEGSAIAYPASVPSSFCFATGSQACGYSVIDAERTSDGFLSCITEESPGSTGLYRTTCRYKLKGTGNTCTPSASNNEQAANPSPPPCQGYLGTVNGKTTCLPTVTPPSPYTPPAGTPKTQSEAHTPSPTSGGRAPSSTNEPAPSGTGPNLGGGTGGSDGSGKVGAARGSGAGASTTDVAAAGPVSGTGLTKGDLPTDYNRESTQQQIRDLLKTDGAPEMPDQQSRVDGAKEDGQTALTNAFDGVKNSVGTDKDSFFSWVWTPQTFECAPSAPASLRGLTISFDGGGLWCEWAEKIRDLLGWLFGLLSAMTVYYQLFRKGD